jgi:hypothetical protein
MFVPEELRPKADETETFGDLTVLQCREGIPALLFGLRAVFGHGLAQGGF